MGREGEDPCTSGTFDKAVVQATLLFGLETWVMTPRIGSTLGEFHHKVDHRMEKMQPKQDMAGRWKYPPLDTDMLAVVLEEV